MSSMVEVSEVKLNGTSLLTASGLKVTVESTAPGTGASSLGKAEDAPHTTGDVGVMMLAVADAEPPALTAAAGDYAPLLVDAFGQLYVKAGGARTVVDVTFVSQAAAFAAGDVLTDQISVPGVTRFNNGTALLTDLIILDGDDNTAAAMTVVLFSANVTLGAMNGAIGISDADALNILGIVQIAAGDWQDLINSRAAHKTGLNIGIKPVSGATNIYAQLVTAGSPTQTVSGLTGRFKFTQD